MKSDETLQLERDIWTATNKQGVFGCFEVTIGMFGNERVDYLTYDTKGIWRCYEIKATKRDFYSPAKKTFVGHYNYYVMPESLYEEVKGDIPNHIGVYVRTRCIKKAKRQPLGVKEIVLFQSLIRSLFREYEKHYLSGLPHVVDSLKRRLEREKKERRQWEERYKDLLYETMNKEQQNKKIIEGGIE